MKQNTTQLSKLTVKDQMTTTSKCSEGANTMNREGDQSAGLQD